MTTAVSAFQITALTLASSLSAAALLGQTAPDGVCTVSVLNQTANVQADGSWEIPNIPSTLGPVRARETCIQNGSTQSGSSDLFLITTNQMNAILPLDLGVDAATPVRIDVSAPATNLTTVGQTAQLIVQAVLADGSAKDVTAGSAGTVYTSTSSRIATVSADGLVRAVASGRVLISAMNEQVLRTVAFVVVVSADSDGDGMPDDWEMAHGLDPNNPADALEDLDHDGLTNREEYTQGTDPANADTDGDGLTDGDEVHRYHTDPLRDDTDGDGIPDGIEVATGSDPLDSASFDLSRALARIDVSPTSFRLIYNVVLGESSRQLAVTGRLIDGRHTIDLTRPVFQTDFSSSDLTIANFGAGPGRVYAGQDGTATITARAGGFTATATVNVQTFAPTFLSFVQIPGFANGVAVDGGYAYVAAGLTGLYVVDVSHLSTPQIVGHVDTPGNANAVRVAGGYAYIADGPGGLAIADVQDPAHPRLVGQVSTGDQTVGLAVTGGRAYLAEGTSGLEIADVGVPASPRILGAVAVPGEARGVDVVDQLAVIAAGSAGVAVVDVADPAAPVLRGSVALQPDVSGAGAVVVRDRLAYVTDGDAYLGGFRIVDFSAPETPVVVGGSGTGYWLSGVALDGGLALFANRALPGTMPIFDVSSTGPSPLPILRAVPSTWGAPIFRTDYGTGIAVQNGALFVSGYIYTSSFVFGQGLTANSGLAIGLYRLPVDLASEPPTVAITSPQAGETVRERTTITLTADATDPVRVDSVQFLVDGVAVGTAYAAPYRAQYTVPAGVQTLRIGAVARDLGGSQAAAQDVTVAVETNTLPVVRLLFPRDGSTALAGSTIYLTAQASDDHAVTLVDFLIDGHLVGSATQPYYIAYPIPNGTTSLAVTTVAHDDAGASAPAGPATVTVVPDQPPVATIVAPLDGVQMVEGTYFDVQAGASDDGGVTRAELRVDGVTYSILGGPPPYFFSVAAPAAGQDVHLQVVVTDTGGHVTASSEVTVHAIADPLTAITGSVVDHLGGPVAAAEVDLTSDQSFTASTTTGADGRFTFSGLPTIVGNFRLAVSGIAQGCAARGELRDPLTPLPGGTLDVGAVALDAPAAAQTTIVIGTFTDEDGQRIAGLTVHVFSEDFGDEATATTGPDGTFTAPGFPARRFGIGAIAGGPAGGGLVYVGSAPGTSANAGGTTDLGTFIVDPYDPASDPGTTFTGRVVDTDGNPVAGVRVSANAQFLFFTATTAADGTFALSGMPSVTPITVGAARADTCQYYNTQLMTVTGNGGDTVDLGILVLRVDNPQPPGQ
jgi:hypothetical protein